MTNFNSNPTSTRPTENANSKNLPSTSFPGDFETFVATLPEWRKTTASFDLRQLWQRSQENADLAQALENRGDELSSLWEHLCAELESRGLTFAELLAYEQQRRGRSPFEGQPDYVLPPHYRSSPGLES